MPYFIDTREGKHCVVKGTKEEPEETVKCHDTRDEALAHLKALHANVPDTSAKGAIADNVTGNLMHGSGGLLNPARSGDKKEYNCTCPSCGHTAKGIVACDKRSCPKCGTKMKEPKVEGKATWDSAYINVLPNSAFLYVEPGENGKRHLPYKNKEGQVDLPHLRNAISRLGQPATGTGENKWLTESLRTSLLAKARGILKKHNGKDEEKFVSYKATDGTWRWLSVSSVAMLDQEQEIVTEKAYDDAIILARETGLYGELDLVHVDGTDVGDCDIMTRLGPLLVEGGSWYDTERAAMARDAVRERQDHYGISIKFRYNPDQFDGVRYTGGIQILKRTILPRTMAASFGTAIAVTGTGGKTQMDEKTKEALRELKIPEDEIARLAEAQKSVDPDPLVKEKEGGGESPEKVETSEAGALDNLKSWLETLFSPRRDTTQPDVEEETAEVDQAPAPAQEPVTPDPEPVPLGDANKVAQALAEQMAEVLKGAIAPLAGDIAKLQEKFVSLEARVVEAERSVEDKVIKRLDDMPPVAKVAPTVVNVTAPAPLVEAKDGPQTPAQVLLKSIGELVTKAIDDQELKLNV